MILKPSLTLLMTSAQVVETLFLTTDSKQLLDEVEHDIMNYQCQGPRRGLIRDIMRKTNSVIVLLYIF